MLKIVAIGNLTNDVELNPSLNGLGAIGGRELSDAV